MIITGYKNILSIDEGFDSGFVFPSAAYNVTKGDIVVAVANDKINNKIKGYEIIKLCGQYPTNPHQIRRIHSMG